MRNSHQRFLPFATGVLSWLMTICPVFAEVTETGKSANAVAEFPESPRITLAKPTQVEDQSDQAAHWAASIAKLAETAAVETDPLKKARLLLAGANLVLARQVEPACSRAIAGLSAVQGEVDQGALPLLEKAQTMIRDADALLAAVPVPEHGADHADEGAEPDPAMSELSALKHAAAALRSFWDGQRVYLFGEKEPGDMRRAASELAPMLEDPDRNVAAAARFWQALLRALEPDSTAPLKILGSPLTTLQPETWPFGLFSRVLYCRLQGAQGAWSSALVNLVQMEEQLEELVPKLAHRGDARRLFAFVRLEILKRWYDALPREQDKERTWCVTQAEDIVKLYFGVETTVLRLEPAVPILVSVEGPKAENPKVEPE